MTSNNLGSAVLLLGTIWFGQNGWLWWHYFLAGLAIATWVYPTGAKEDKELMRAQTRYYDARTAFLVKEKKPE